MASKFRLTSRLNLWKDALPQVRPYYAVKCNPDPMLMRWLKEAGTGFDCASGMELEAAAKLFDNQSYAESTVFANPCKPPRDIATAMRLGSGPTTVDSVEEIEKLAEKGWNRGVLIRLAVEDKGSMMPFSSKFGTTQEVLPMIQSAARSLGQEVKGVSFHVGSGCMDPLQYSKAIQMALLSVGIIKGTKIVDIGGGFESSPQKFHHAARYIQQSIKAIPSSLDIKWIAEPGRFMATEFQDLFVPVIGKKPAVNRQGWRYTIDESLYGQFSCIPFDRAVPKWVRVRMSDKEKPRKFSKGILFGRTCDSVDKIAEADMEELEVGDWLWFPHHGAYTSVTATEFNGFPKSKTWYLENNGLPHTTYMGYEPWPTNVKTVSHVVA